MRDPGDLPLATVALTGVLSQGAPIDESSLPEAAEVPADQIDAHEYVLRVKGTSLRAFGIEPADLLIIEPRPEGRAATGELVLAELGERVFLGRWWMKQGRRVLMDAVIQPITENADLRVIGTVTVIVRHETPGGRRRQ
ncbi:MAG TPA: S24 family peptidase [Thermoanaerobaculia bacterium]|nr:S24 family peptidase [Thermoanaerobaculia bacterium]